MMGIKERTFQPFPDDLSLEVLVPKDNFYRRLEERIDLSFVRELVLPLYAKGGRHSIDPVVFFKLQLVLFFENLRSERQLMEVVADRLSLRWYVGYDLCEPLPDHSSLTKIRERYGLEIFRNFFERIVEMCVEAGLVRGKELFFDSTKLEADAAVDSLAPRWFVEAHLQDLFEEDDDHSEREGEPQGEEFEDEESIHSLPTAGNEDLIQSNCASEDWISRSGKRIGPLAAAPEKEPPTPGPPRPTLTPPP
jgi:transposase